MNNTKMLVLPFDDALYTSNQLYAYLRPYTLDWQNEESDSLHLEYSYNGFDWYALNGNNGVLFPSTGSKRLVNPKLYELNNGLFYITAEDILSRQCLFSFLTQDFIHYTEETYYTESLPNYSVITQSPDKKNRLKIPIQILTSLQKVWGKPEPVRLIKTEQIELSYLLGEEPTLPSKILVEYSNQMQETRIVNWCNLPDRILSTKGAYQVKGTIQESIYPTPLIMHRADPYIYKHTDGYYYFTASYTDMEHNLDGRYQYLYIILRRASSIMNLADGSNAYEEKIIFEKKPIANGALSPHIWAPEIHYIDGIWVVYYSTTISDESPWRIRPHCLICAGDDPFINPWDDNGPMKTLSVNDIAFTDFSLDHTHFEHRGIHYLVWAQKTNNISDIWMARLENPWTICTKSVRLSHPEFNWELHGFAVNEGPSIIKRNKKIFLSFSSSGTDSMYCMGLLTADENADLLDADSWYKLPYPIFQSSKATKQYGPGHNSFTLSEDDYEDFIIYHGREETRYLIDETYQPLYDAGRNAYVGKVFWNPDGTPNFSVPGAGLTRDKKNLEVTALINII